MAIAGFVVGLVGLLLSWFIVLGLIICIVGLVLSIVGMRQANERNAPRGLATAGLVCAIIGIVIAVIVLIAVIVAGSDTTNQITFTYSTNFQ